MWLFRKRRASAVELEKSIQDLRRKNMKSVKQSIEKINKPIQLLKDSENDPTMMIFLATGGDKRDKRS